MIRILALLATVQAYIGDACSDNDDCYFRREFGYDQCCVRSVGICSSSKGEFYRNSKGEIVVISQSDCLDLGETIRQSEPAPGNLPIGPSRNYDENDKLAYKQFIEATYNYPEDGTVVSDDAWIFDLILVGAYIFIYLFIEMFFYYDYYV